MEFRITPKQMGYPDDWQSKIPEGYVVDGAGVPEREPDTVFLSRDHGIFHSEKNPSRGHAFFCIRLRKKQEPLADIEQRYGKGATPESVWAKACLNPEDYGKPRYGPQDSVAHGWVQSYHDKTFFGVVDSHMASDEDLVWAPKLTPKQKEISQVYPGCYSIEDVLKNSAPCPITNPRFEFRVPQVDGRGYWCTRSRKSWYPENTPRAYGCKLVIALPRTKTVTRKRIIFEQIEDRKRPLRPGEHGFLCGIPLAVSNHDTRPLCGGYIPCRRTDEEFQVEVEDTDGSAS